jgi:hypothetical protein
VNEFAPETVHFLKIDVEGFELEVLRGADWENFRPWVVLVETTVPLKGGTENPAVLDLMQQKGYRRTLFDGVNTYFIAQEHAELERCFIASANSFDHFQPAMQMLMQEEIRARDALLVENANLRAAEQKAAQESLRIDREAWQSYTRKLADARKCVSDMQGSLSWKMTAPLRLLHGLVFYPEATSKMLRKKLGPAADVPKSPSPLLENPVPSPVRVPELLPDFPADTMPEGGSSPWADLRFPLRPESSEVRLSSGLCTKSQLESPAFRFWLDRIEVLYGMHRKLWEFAYVIQALYERGCLVPGRRGLGFAVGEEPLPALFASMGCEITATDLNPDDERARPWAETAQLASAKENLNRPSICSAPMFEKHVLYRHVDMNRIPRDLVDFDFTWSSCSFEHCGSIALGLSFVENQMACLRPGGIAVHTTEFNLSSNTETLTDGMTVIFRKQDIEGLVQRLREQGHHVEPISYILGKSKEDEVVDVFPYTTDPHLKLLIAEKYVSTSIGLIIRRGGN